MPENRQTVAVWWAASANSFIINRLPQLHFLKFNTSSHKRQVRGSSFPLDKTGGKGRLDNFSLVNVIMFCEQYRE